MKPFTIIVLKMMFCDSKVLWEFYQLTDFLDLLIVFWQSGGISYLCSKSAIIYYLKFTSFAISFLKLKNKNAKSIFHLLANRSNNLETTKIYNCICIVMNCV